MCFRVPVSVMVAAAKWSAGTMKGGAGSARAAGEGVSDVLGQECVSDVLGRLDGKCRRQLYEYLVVCHSY